MTLSPSVRTCSSAPWISRAAIPRPRRRGGVKVCVKATTPAPRAAYSAMARSSSTASSKRFFARLLRTSVVVGCASVIRSASPDLAFIYSLQRQLGAAGSRSCNALGLIRAVAAGARHRQILGMNAGAGQQDVGCQCFLQCLLPDLQIAEGLDLA